MENRVINQEKRKAKFAFSCVKDFIDNHTIDEHKKYRTYIRSMPTMILNNGIGATIAFLLSKSEKEEVHSKIGINIYDWLLKKHNRNFIELNDKEDKDKLKELTEQIISLSSSEYRAIEYEIISLISWFKRFVEGMIEEADENGEKEKE